MIRSSRRPTGSCASISSSAARRSSSAPTASRISSRTSSRPAIKRVYRLRTRAGYELRLTADHKILTEERGDVALSDVIIGERIVLRGSGFGSRSLDEPTLNALAARVGSQSLVAVGNRFAIFDAVDEFVRQDTQLHFAPAIYTLDRASIATLLRALFDECGEFSSGSMELLWQVQLLLLSFGIKGKIYRDRGVIRIAAQSRARFVRTIEGGEAFERSREVLTDEVAQIKAFGVEAVYDLTESDTAHFVANGLVVHNCSEYLFLDGTACNLASLNLVKFTDATGHFEPKRFADACRIWTYDARDQRADGAIPVGRDRAEIIRLPHARPRLRESRERCSCAWACRTTRKKASAGALLSRRC